MSAAGEPTLSDGPPRVAANALVKACTFFCEQHPMESFSPLSTTIVTIMERIMSSSADPADNDYMALVAISYYFAELAASPTGSR